MIVRRCGRRTYALGGIAAAYREKLAPVRFGMLLRRQLLRCHPLALVPRPPGWTGPGTRWGEHLALLLCSFRKRRKGGRAQRLLYSSRERCEGGGRATQPSAAGDRQVGKCSEVGQKICGEITYVRCRFADCRRSMAHGFSKDGMYCCRNTLFSGRFQCLLSSCRRRNTENTRAYSFSFTAAAG